MGTNLFDIRSSGLPADSVSWKDAARAGLKTPGSRGEDATFADDMNPDEADRAHDGMAVRCIFKIELPGRRKP